MLPELDFWEGLVRLLLAGVLAGAVGWERERAEQDAGLRTHILVAGGACLFMIVGIYAWHDMTLNQQIGAIVDPSRVASYVVAGVGFLGGGAIIRHGATVRGLTTAASIWVVAAIGVAVGAGLYAFAVATTLLVLVSLWPLKQLAKLVGLRQTATRRLRVVLEPDGEIATVLERLRDLGLVIDAITIDEQADRRSADLVLRRVEEGRAGAALDVVGRLDRVRSVQWAH